MISGSKALSGTTLRKVSLSLLLALALAPLAAGVAGQERPAEAGKQPPQADKQAPQETPKPDELERLIQRLGSSSFADRQEATQELRRLGKAALEAVRNVAASSKDPEVRRRAAEVLEELLERPWSKAYREACRLLEEKKAYRKAATLLEEAIQLYEKDPAITRPSPGKSDDPSLAEMKLRLGRAYAGLKEYENAARAYHGAIYHYDYSRDRREQIEREWSAMLDRLVAGWEKDIVTNAGKDAIIKRLVAKYPLVVLHSRRLASGSYFRSAYSFIDETTDERKHRNYVQLLFDNGSKENTFEINMLVGQHNLVVDLGAGDFTKDPDPRSVDPDGDNFWMPGGCKAVERHVYLEHIRDDRGNKFYVLLQILATDKGGRYMAFVWRRLPGGKVVKRP
jgi:tetratricopeptide (TPR) repeat protein